MIKPFPCFILLSAKFSKKVQPLRGFPLLHFAYRKIQQKWEAFPFVKASPCLVFAVAKIGKKVQPLSEASPRGEAVNEVD